MKKIDRYNVRDTKTSVLVSHFHDNIREVEKNFLNRKETPQEQIDYIKGLFLFVYDRCITVLMKSVDRFVVGFLQDIKMEIDFNINAPAGVTLKKPIVIKYNPLLFIGYSLYDTLFVIVHEILHIVYLHAVEYDMLKSENNHKMFNIAADISINDIIADQLEIKYTGEENINKTLDRPENLWYAETLQKLLDRKNRKIKVEKYQPLLYYYKLLLENKDAIPDLNEDYEKGYKDGMKKAISERVEQSQGQGKEQGDGQGQGQGKEQGDGQGSKEYNNGFADGYGAAKNMLDGNFNNSQGQSFGSGQSSAGMNKTDKGKPFKTRYNRDDFEHGFEPSGEIRPDELKDEMSNIIKDIWRNNAEKSRGTLSSGVLQQIESLFKKAKINWKDLLKKKLGLIPTPFRRTKMRLNRRQPFRCDLSGRVPKYTSRIIAAIDTSGSMSEAEIFYCINEIFHIIKGKEDEIPVEIVECDAEICKHYIAKSPKDLQLDVKGRGGTSFTPVIEMLNSAKGKYKNAILIYFTDGGGEMTIPRPQTFANIWVLTSGEYLSVEKPYGEVRSLEEDEKFKRKFR